MDTPTTAQRLDDFDPDAPEPAWPVTPDDFRAAWAEIEAQWDEVAARARTLDPQLLHRSVDGEWSFTQTLRHLLYATDVWINRVMLGDPRPWHQLDLPFDGLPAHPEVSWDADAQPELETVLALRAERLATVREVLAGLTPEHLAGTTEPVEGPSWPPADRYRVWDALACVINEEWRHRQYAARDLDVLASEAREEASR